MEPNTPEPRLGREPIPAGEVSGRVQAGPPPLPRQTPPPLPGQEVRGKGTPPPLPESYLQQNKGSATPPPLPGQPPPLPNQAGRVQPSGTKYFTGKFNPKAAGKSAFSGKFDGVTKRLAGKITSKLNEAIAQGHTTGPFIFMMIIAGLKDLMDATEDGVILLIQAIPGVGQVIGGFVDPAYSIFAFLISTILILFMQSQGWFTNQKLRVTLWVISLCDVIPIVGMLPMQMFSVWYVFNEIKKRAKRAEAKKNAIEKMSAQQLQNFDDNFEDELANVQL